MATHEWLHAALLVALAFLLSGCGGGGGPTPTPTPRAARRTIVIVMRHCIRSTPWDGVLAVPNFTYVNNYSAKPWPAFSEPPMYCLPRGEDIIEGQGRWWKSQGGFEEPLKVIADLIPEDKGQRDNVTMHRFLKGLGVSSSEVASLDHGYFAPVRSAECDNFRPNEDAMRNSAAAHLEANPPPASYQESMDTLFAVMGLGAAGDWRHVNCTIGLLPDGLPLPVGACQAAATFLERLLMQWGGGMTVGWGNVSAAQIPQLLLLHAWYFFNWMAPTETYRYQGTSMARALSSTLGEHKGGTKIFVGHDSDMMMLSGALGLTWDPKPFPSNATLPGSMLRFVREGDRVSSTYFYVDSFSASSGNMVSVEAKFASSSVDIPFAEFEQLADKGSIAACAYKAEVPQGQIVV